MSNSHVNESGFYYLPHIRRSKMFTMTTAHLSMVFIVPSHCPCPFIHQTIVARIGSDCDVCSPLPSILRASVGLMNSHEIHAMQWNVRHRRSYHKNWIGFQVVLLGRHTVPIIHFWFRAIACCYSCMTKTYTTCNRSLSSFVSTTSTMTTVATCAQLLATRHRHDSNNSEHWTANSNNNNWTRNAFRSDFDLLQLIGERWAAACNIFFNGTANLFKVNTFVNSRRRSGDRRGFIFFQRAFNQWPIITVTDGRGGEGEGVTAREHRRKEVKMTTAQYFVFCFIFLSMPQSSVECAKSNYFATSDLRSIFWSKRRRRRSRVKRINNECVEGLTWARVLRCCVRCTMHGARCTERCDCITSLHVM